MSRPSSHDRFDVHRVVTESIIVAIENGAGEFVMPWHGASALVTKPENAHTGMDYHGINVLALWAAAIQSGFSSGYWATYRQWQKLGAQVNKGERASVVVFYKKITVGEDDDETTRLFARASWVFNVSQVLGWAPPEETEHDGTADLGEAATTLISATGAAIEWGGASAHYHIPTDRIHMPDKERFHDTAAGTAEHGLHSTILHELVHWTGSSHRLGRFGARLPKDEVPFEELVAEIGAAFLCADLGISVSPRPDHAAYVAHWLKMLKDDTRAIFRAARLASQAANYVHELATPVA